MDFFEKLDELHAKEVSPKKFKEVNGVSQKKVMKNVMDFVDKFDAKQAEPKNGKKGKVVTMRSVAMPLDSAAVVLDPVAAKPAAAKKRAVSARAARAAAKPADVLAAKIAKALAAEGIGIKGIKFVEGPGLIKKVKRGGSIPKVAKGPKGGGPKM